MTRFISVAIDGPAGAGKSTVAKAVAAAINGSYLDTGAMYRAVGIHMLRRGIDPRDRTAVEKELPAVDVDVKYVGGAQRVFLGREDVTDLLRTDEATAASSDVSAIVLVRERMVARQKEIAAGRNVVMDGRDIGTDVLPSATLKIYLVADPAERARRRQAEMARRGVIEPFEKVLSDIEARDYADSTRKASPLKKAKDAVELDSTHMTESEVADAVLRMLKEKRVL